MPSPKKGAKGAAPQLVWVRAYGKACKVSPYTAARVVGHQDGKAKVVPDGGGEASLVNETDLMQRNPPGARPDNCQLLHLNEACVLENVAVRYASSEIYTWTSHVLTAVNPYEILRLYGDEIAAVRAGSECPCYDEERVLSRLHARLPGRIRRRYVDPHSRDGGPT